MPRYACDGVAEGVELLPRCALFIQGRVIVIAGRIGLVVVSITVGAVHPAEAGASVKHVHTDRVALAKHPLEFRRLACPVGLMMLLAPVMDPACPILAAHARPIWSQRCQFRKAPLCIPGAEVDH